MIRRLGVSLDGFWRLVAGLALALALTASPANRAAASETWSQTLEGARGQTVYWYAWGGETRINAYIRWVANEVADRFAITLQHVKVADTADVVARVLAEKAAGRDADGDVDLVWINGANFAAMKEGGLLLDEAWAERLPNAALLGSPDARALLTTDFGVPTEGREAPPPPAWLCPRR